MIDKSAVIPVVLARMKKLAVSETLELLTWKKDRSVLLIKQGEDNFLVRENGFKQQEFQVDGKKLKKLLKTLLKREFPRSHKVRLNDRKKCQILN